MLNAFCIDLEEWFHICGVETRYDDPSTWEHASSFVKRDTAVLLRLLDEAKARATFLTVGWLANRYPELVEEIAKAGHEIGCHGYHHRLVYELSPDQFTEDVSRTLSLLRQISGQTVSVYRAPGFSITSECFWAYPILAQNGITIDVSVVPAAREHGGIKRFQRDPFTLVTESGDLTIFPVSVLKIAGKTVPFSGGGYLRLFPMSLVHYGFRQNNDELRPCMVYVHPREINRQQPRLQIPIWRYFKYYVGIRRLEGKLRELLASYPFGTVSETVAGLTIGRRRLVGHSSRQALSGSSNKIEYTIE